MSTTGIAGFTLGSGSGWIERKHGLAADNLLSAEVVLAGGSVQTASEVENPDLFWALRGGGGNFGVVTEFEFRLHPVGPIMLGGMLAHPGERAGEVLRFFREFMAQAPDEVGAAAALITAPNLPFVPEPARGKPAAGIIACYVGEPQEGERVLAPLREFGPPVVDLLQPMPYTAVQRLIDPYGPAGMQNYWGGDFLSELSDDAIDVFCSAAATVPSPLSQILILPGGGQIARVPEDAMVIGQRHAPWNTHLIGMWSDLSETKRNVEWVRELRAASPLIPRDGPSSTSSARKATCASGVRSGTTSTSGSSASRTGTTRESVPSQSEHPAQPFGERQLSEIGGQCGSIPAIERVRRDPPGGRGLVHWGCAGSPWLAVAAMVLALSVAPEGCGARSDQAGKAATGAPPSAASAAVVGPPPR